jgi:hypothetical protein
VKTDSKRTGVVCQQCRKPAVVIDESRSTATVILFRCPQVRRGHPARQEQDLSSDYYFGVVGSVVTNFAGESRSSLRCVHTRPHVSHR